LSHGDDVAYLYSHLNKKKIGLITGGSDEFCQQAGHSFKFDEG